MLNSHYLKQKNYVRDMGELKLYNSFIKKAEPFIAKGSVKMYNCGPTVYDRAHLGNLRYFVAVDILRRYLEYKGYKVKQVMNITDVGHMMADSDEGTDKIEEAAKRAGVPPEKIVGKYTELFFKDINALNIKKAWKYPAASKHVGEMIKMVAKLLKTNFAYEADGSVYYDLSKFPAYGKLSGNAIKDLKAGARVEVAPGKRRPYDFALWISKPGHLLEWQAPWGRGYPGWHIECSAMALKYLGKTLDIHTGGEDNKFPHHEAEIAQSEASNRQKFARYWIHTAHLLVNGEKMSKSLGNFYTLDDVISRGYSPREVRYLLSSVHYRDSLNFTFDSLDGARAALSRLDEFWVRLCNAKKGKASFKNLAAKAQEEFESALDDDLNISKALSALWSFARGGNRILDEGIPAKEAREAKKLLLKFDSVLGIGFKIRGEAGAPTELRGLIAKREDARKKKDFKTADALRNKIKKLGFEVEDTAKGPKLKKIQV